jgi:hypothetical protein
MKRRVFAEFPDGDEDVEMAAEDEFFFECDDLVNDEEDQPPKMLSEMDLKAEAEEIRGRRKADQDGGAHPC